MPDSQALPEPTIIARRHGPGRPCGHSPCRLSGMADRDMRNAIAGLSSFALQTAAHYPRHFRPLARRRPIIHEQHHGALLHKSRVGFIS